MTKHQAKFSIGEVIHHRIFDYRGVIIDVDPEFQGTDEWYVEVARSRPPKNKPWYHVLVHNARHQTYVAERNLEADTENEPINHPFVPMVFIEFRDGMYTRKDKSN